MPGTRPARRMVRAAPLPVVDRVDAASCAVGIGEDSVFGSGHRGATVRGGDRYGVMKFGSRMDVFLPASAEIRVRVGDMVRGAESIIAVLH